jgi:sirohydrochlorin cobaltochelatase
MSKKPAVVLVGHGSPARDTPRALIERLRALEGARRAQAGASGPSGPSAEEAALDLRVREWPRTPATDPYREGIQALACVLAGALEEFTVRAAYNEFCAPSLDVVVAELAADGVTDITIVTTMVTEGGVHAERELPENIAELRLRYPQVTLVYAWPFAREAVGALLANRVRESR